MANVIITGSSRGIGFELVKLFANHGHQVLALSRNEKPVKALNHKNINCFPFDISNPSDLNKIAKFLNKNWNTVDILINNAGKLLKQTFFGN